MKEVEVKELVDQNMRLCHLVGVMYANIIKPDDRWKKWIGKAIESVVYKNGPLPEMPE
jgi:hypothetical protein